MKTQKQNTDNLTFEKVWQLFQETREQMKETDKMIHETSEQMKVTDKKFQDTDKKFQDTDKKLRKLENLFTGQWGKLIESLVEGDLINLLKRRNIDVTRTFSRATFRYNNTNGEIDIIAANGNEVVVVEVKTTLHPTDVEDFFEVLNIFKKAFPEYSNKKVYGAVAYLKAESKSNVRAEELGLFVIKATGSSSSITNNNEFKPKEF